MGKITDEELVARVKQGDIASFEVLVERYEKPLFYYARQVLMDSDCAEDAVQEAFLLAYKNIQGFDVKRKFSSWIYRIVHNESINLLRARKKVTVLDEAVEVAWEGDLAQSVRKKLDSPESVRILRKAFEKIPSKYREVVYLRFYQEKSYEEIAEIMHLPVNTVGTYLSRAKQSLRWEMKDVNLEDLI